MKKLILSILFLCGWVVLASAEVKSEDLTYAVGDKTFKGYIAYDDALTEKRPGIIVVHEWWGHNEYVRQRARQLAELGYVAMAIDMYGDGKIAQNPDEAGTLSKEVYSQPEAAKERFTAALEVLKNFQWTDKERIGAIGYCFGGSTVLNMAIAGVNDLDGVVSFHGGLQLPASEIKEGEIKSKILICQGAADTFVPEDQVKAFTQILDQTKADYQLISYAGAGHSFTNPQADDYAKQFNLPISYNKEADEKSWKDMQDFFNTIFAKTESTQ